MFTLSFDYLIAGMQSRILESGGIMCEYLGVEGSCEDIGEWRDHVRILGSEGII